MYNFFIKFILPIPVCYKIIYEFTINMIHRANICFDKIRPDEYELLCIQLCACILRKVYLNRQKSFIYFFTTVYRR